MAATDTDIHVNDIGTVFRITIKESGSIVDLSSGSPTANILWLKKPDGTSASYVTEFTTDGSDGKIQYIVSGSDVLDQSGNWRITANVNTSGGQWTATAIEFIIKSKFGIE